MCVDHCDAENNGLRTRIRRWYGNQEKRFRWEMSKLKKKNKFTDDENNLKRGEKWGCVSDVLGNEIKKQWGCECVQNTKKEMYD